MAKPSPSPLGRRIKRARERAGLSARAVSVAVGRSHSWLRQVETGAIREPSGSVLLALAGHLGVPLTALLEADRAA